MKVEMDIKQGVVGSGARFESSNGSCYVYEAAVAAQLAYVTLDRAINKDGTVYSYDEVELALNAVRDTAEKLTRLGESALAECGYVRLRV
jgi:hypothetical protein